MTARLIGVCSDVTFNLKVAVAAVAGALARRVFRRRRKLTLRARGISSETPHRRRQASGEHPALPRLGRVRRRRYHRDLLWHRLFSARVPRGRFRPEPSARVRCRPGFGPRGCAGFARNGDATLCCTSRPSGLLRCRASGDGRLSAGLSAAGSAQHRAAHANCPGAWPGPSQSVSLAAPTQRPTPFATESAGVFSDKAGHASQSRRPAARQGSATANPLIATASSTRRSVRRSISLSRS